MSVRAAFYAGRRGAARHLLALNDRIVVATFIVAEWAITLGLALTVRHNGWIYYQGGDQLWSYTTAWLFGHGASPQPLVGYLWPTLLLPIALVAGPNVANAYPTIVLLDVVVLMPMALLALYGTARLIAGRLFAYWVLLLWLVVPLIGIAYTNTGYHQRYTELLLPQGFGLTAMTDFPTMVASLVAAYFCARIVFGRDRSALTAMAGGLAAGASLGLKPSNALFFAGPPLALLFARRAPIIGWFLAGLAPSVLLLALWKYRGYGDVPLLNGTGGTHLAAGPELVALQVPQYAHFDWHHFTAQLDLLREHFWSARLIEWSVVAGMIGAARRSWAAFVFVGGWFGAFALVKGGASQTTVEDTNLLRILIPAAPAFVLLLASLPFVIPGATRRLAIPPERPRRRSRPATWTVLAVAGLVTVVAPAAIVAAATPLHGPNPRAVGVQQPPLPAHLGLGLRATRRAGGVTVISWRSQHAVGGTLFYHLFRAPLDAPLYSCPPAGFPAEQCNLQAADLGAVHGTTFVDRTSGAHHWQYVVGVSANWLNDVTLGDVYELSAPVSS